MPKKPVHKKKSNHEDSRFRSNLLAVISHELNTPISVILNAAELLEQNATDKDALLMVRRNAERLQRTVRNLMEIARVDAGALKVRLSELDLANFVRMRVETLRAQLERARFKLDLSIEDDLPHACGDLVRLAHVFDSLVMNAAKFSNTASLPASEFAHIKVEVKLESAALLPNEFREPSWGKKTGLYLTVSIQSSLPPIGESPNHFEELFEPFTPWRDADSRAREGLGVELALAKEILSAHEGFIWADMRAGSGWKFHFALPMLSRSDELDMVLANRLFTAIGALSKVSLLILRPAPGAFSEGRSVMDVIKTVQKLLFRSSDSIFWIEETGELTILMDDCDEIGARRVGERIVGALSDTLPGLSFMWTIVTGPTDGSSAEELLEKARDRWQPAP